MRSNTLLTVTTLAALTAAACSDDTPTDANLQTGTVSATLVDEPSPVPVSDGSQAQIQAAFSGTIQAQTRVEIYSESDGWVEVAGSQSTQMVLGGSAQAVLGSSSEVRAGVPYTRVRLTMAGGEAVIDAGATLGSLLLLADLTLSLGDGGSVTIEKEITPFTVQADATSSLRIDLNSELWVTEDNADNESVSEEEMSSAADVEVE